MVSILVSLISVGIYYFRLILRSQSVVKKVLVLRRHSFQDLVQDWMCPLILWLLVSSETVQPDDLRGTTR